MPDDLKEGPGFHVVQTGRADAPVHIVWGHGWGQSGAALMPLAESLNGLARQSFIDFPGFGASPPPDAVWGTDDYADAVAAWLRRQPPGPIVWAGHSFGVRVGLQIAGRHPNLLRGLFLIAGAGLRPRRPLPRRVRVWVTIRMYKILKKLLVSDAGVAWLKIRFGSADYRSAGVMRPIFVKTVNEDLGDVARRVACPAVLVYGADDTETPPEIGRRLAMLIPHAELHVLPGLDHYTILSTGRSQTAYLLHQLVERVT